MRVATCLNLHQSLVGLDGWARNMSGSSALVSALPRLLSATHHQSLGVAPPLAAMHCKVLYLSSGRSMWAPLGPYPISFACPSPGECVCHCSSLASAARPALAHRNASCEKALRPLVRSSRRRLLLLRWCFVSVRPLGSFPLMCSPSFPSRAKRRRRSFGAHRQMEIPPEFPPLSSTDPRGMEQVIPTWIACGQGAFQHPFRWHVWPACLAGS